VWIDTQTLSVMNRKPNCRNRHFIWTDKLYCHTLKYDKLYCHTLKYDKTTWYDSRSSIQSIDSHYELGWNKLLKRLRWIINLWAFNKVRLSPIRHSRNLGLRMERYNVESLCNIAGRLTEFQTKNLPNIFPHVEQQFICSKFVDCLCHW
jgi:hypothetical protein